MRKITLGIDGMTCSACSNAIENYLLKQEGVKSASVNLILAFCTVVYDESKLSVKQIEKYISNIGYKSKGIYKLEDQNVLLKKKKAGVIAFGFVALLLMVISMLGMGGYLPKALNNPVVYGSILLFLTLVLIGYGIDILYHGFKNLFKGKPTMDSLVALGVLFSFSYSMFALIKIYLGNGAYMHNLYFEACGIIIYFIKLGRYLDNFAKDKTKGAIKELVTITPSYALKKVGDGLEKVTIDKVRKDDILGLTAGEKVAVDGIVLSGTCHVDESFITGESMPVKKQVGDKVVAGSISFDGYIEYQAKDIGKDSTVSKIVDLVASASSSKMPIAKVSDKVSSFFIPIIMSIAFLCFILYMIITKNFEKSLITAVTILVVACPCSLGLGTPVAIMVGVGSLAKNGLLIKNSQAVEFMSHVDTIVFDKTGTLTMGKLQIDEIYSVNLSKNELLSMVCALEERSNHPLASAFKNAQIENTKINIENFEELSGLGISAKVDGKTVLIGSKKLMEKYNLSLPESLTNSKIGFSEVFVAIDEQVEGLILIRDKIRPEAHEVISTLYKMGIEPILLSGDNENVARLVSEELGIKKFYASVSPSDKADFIKKLKAEKRKVAMVGDGINDSPSLALADVGISLSGSSDIAINSADILITGSLSKLIYLINKSKQTLKIIKQNLFWAFFYNCLMIPIAAGALSFINVTINPMLASLAMVLSSLSVILNALRLNKGVKYEKNLD